MTAAEDQAAGLVGSAPPPADVAGGRVLVAVGPVEGEFLAVQVHDDRADVEFGAAEDVGDFGAGFDLPGFRVEVQRRVDDDVAEVERAGHRRGDDDDRERRPLIRTGEVDLAVRSSAACCRCRRGSSRRRFRSAFGQLQFFCSSTPDLARPRVVFVRFAVGDAGESSRSPPAAGSG